MSEMKLGRVEIVYPQEFHDAVAPIRQMIDEVHADIARITGINELTATEARDTFGRDARIAAARFHIEQLQKQYVAILARFMPQMTIYPEDGRLTLAPSPDRG